MSDRDSAEETPHAPPPPRRTRKLRGIYMVAAGVVFAFLPLLITLVGSIFVDDAFNEGESSLGTLPWLTILTMPIGGVIVVIGIVVGGADVARRN